ncbi:MAG TPA: AbrB/MazE/SpoVT family DNA-binding domain-containing protein [Caulobacteraceae bacterium]
MTVARNGQITLTEGELRHLGAAPGETVDVDLLPGRRAEIRGPRRAGKISDVFGILERPGQPARSIEEINEAIARGWAGLDREDQD